MSDRLGTRTPNGKITARPVLDVTGQPYRWQNVSAVALPSDKMKLCVLPIGVKLTPELEAELLAEIGESVQEVAPTPEQLAEAALPDEEVQPRAQRRSKATSED